ncbi:MAG: sulfotransferase [Ectothiorhodospiraceae bacterium]|jgi:hypothetical protein|nr:sulfotransferase [Ectothiorhodospiraceae bacterium]
MNDSIRICLVGCSRSGTTIMQREMARRYRLLALPETEYFLGALATPRDRALRLHRLQRMSTACASGVGRFRKAVELLGYWPARVGMARLVGALSSRQRAAVEWSRWMDAEARRAGWVGWIEKTPRHFRHLDLIQGITPTPHVLFVVRGGRDVVASIVDRAMRYPERFGGQDVDHAVDLWNDAVRVAAQESRRAGVICVRFEDFIADPYRMIGVVGARFGLGAPTAPEWLPSDAPDPFVRRPEQEWLAGAAQPIELPENKWLKVLSPEQRAYADERLDFASYRRILFTP